MRASRRDQTVSTTSVSGVLYVVQEVADENSTILLVAIMGSEHVSMRVSGSAHVVTVAERAFRNRTLRQN